MNRTDYAVLSLSALAIADGLMTLPYWHLEGNPIVLAAGPEGMMLAKLGAVSALLWLWFGDRVDTTHPVNKPLVWCLTAVYALVVVSNAVVVMA